MFWSGGMADKVRMIGVQLASAPAVADADRRVIQNEILLGLPRRERALVLSKSEFGDFPARTTLAEMAGSIEYCYFLNGGVVSIIHVMSDGKSVEVGLTGKEGFVGLPLIVGYSTSPTRAIVQIEAKGYKIRAQDLKSALGSCPRLEEGLHRYSQELSIQAIQIAACNRLHEVDERLARWLLMSQDRVGESTFPLTQEFISHMLGTRRASVTVAAGILQKAGLITYSRGQVTIENRAGLESAACECYMGINRQIERWHRDSS
jgi:CRP-like cAMP-binding protein